MNTTTKGIKLLIALCIVFHLASCAISSERKLSQENKLVGEWIGTDSTGKTGTFIFNNDGSAKLIKDNKVFDGSSVGGALTWKLDDNHDPMHLDLVMSNKSGGSRKLPMIIRFLGENKLQVCISEDKKSRPIGFLEAEDKNQIILKRQ